MPKVFVANYQDMDFTPAQQFGELVFITQGYIPLNDLEKVRAQIKKFVDLSSPSDYIIQNGPSVIVTLLAVLWFMKHGYINMLSWNSKTKSYKHFVVGVDSVK